ncbi:hypothetical protein MishRS11D_05110 [Methylomagnum ishizawai]|nr:hypothetical protein MishRS11D_05110 [Methylomagnum ishizawai]
MKKLRTLLFAAPFLAFSALAPSVDAAPILVGSGPYTGISGIDISGTSYDVTFIEGAYDSLSSTHFGLTQGNDTLANAIASAIANVLLAGPTTRAQVYGLTGTGSGSSILIPVGIGFPFGSGTPFVVGSQVHSDFAPSNWQVGTSPTPLNSPTNDTTTGDLVYVDVTLSAAAVPEPTSLALFAAGLAAAAVRRKPA